MTLLESALADCQRVVDGSTVHPSLRTNQVRELLGGGKAKLGEDGYFRSPSDGQPVLLFGYSQMAKADENHSTTSSDMGLNLDSGYVSELCVRACVCVVLDHAMRKPNVKVNSGFHAKAKSVTNAHVCADANTKHIPNAHLNANTSANASVNVNANGICCVLVSQ